MKYFFLRLGIALAFQTVFVILVITFNLDTRFINGICTIISMVASNIIVEKYFPKYLDNKK
jgi:C4-dicarboxylate transporter